MNNIENEGYMELSKVVHFEDSLTLTSFVRQFFSQRIQDIKVEVDNPQDEKSRVISISDKETCRCKVICMQNSVEVDGGVSSVISNVVPLNHWYISKVIDLTSVPTSTGGTQEYFDGGNKRKSDELDGEDQKKVKMEDSSDVDGYNMQHDVMEESLNHSCIDNTNEGDSSVEVVKRNGIHSGQKEKKKSPYEYTHPSAPLSQVWIETLKNDSVDKNISFERSSIYEKLKGIGNGCSTTTLDDGGSLLGRKWVWDEGYYYTEGGEYAPSSTNEQAGRTRRSGGITSLKLSQVISELAGGKLNPHTLISTEPYTAGPEYRFTPKMQDTTLMRTLLREFGGVDSIQPFSVCISPDAMFVADLHAHLVDCEIIGLLGGRWDQEERCVYIQAAFPCRALTRDDSGHTDVEMDPVSQVNVQNVIQNHGLKVLGWYHSHPSFQPDPSVTDVENQGNYQKLFYDTEMSMKEEDNCPFVGLIVGTYDPRNPTSRSIIKWFHVVPKETGNVVSLSSGNNSLVINESSGQLGPTKERIHFPVELKVSYRSYRYSDPQNESRENLTVNGRALRRRSYNRIFQSFLDKKKLEESRVKNDRPQAVQENIDVSNVEATTNVSLVNNPPETTVSNTENVQPNKEDVPSSETIKEYTRPTLPQDNPNNKCATLNHTSAESDITSFLTNMDQSFSFADGVHWMHTSNIIETDVSIQDTAEKNNEKSNETEMQVDPESNDSIQQSDYFILNTDGSLTNAVSVSKISEVNNGVNGNNGLNTIETQKKKKLRFILPLPYTRNEYCLLQTSTLTDEEKATIIWNAVEREQLRHYIPYASNDIKELPEWTRKNIGQNNIHPASSKMILNSLFDDSSADIVLIDAIDAILSYYSINPHRVEMIDVWNGGKGDSTTGYQSKSSANAFVSNTSTSSVSSTNGKIKKGVKVCGSLLRWCQRMQLDSRRLKDFGPLYRTRFSSEADEQIDTSETHLYFITQVMRLLACKWREGDVQFKKSKRDKKKLKNQRIRK